MDRDDAGVVQHVAGDPNCGNRLFNMQINEYVKDVMMKLPDRDQLNSFAVHVRSLIYCQTEIAAYQVIDYSWLLKEAINFPLTLPFDLNVYMLMDHNKCRWKSPLSVDIFGNWRLTSLAEDAFLDMNVVMPEDSFASRDYLNFAYHVKRAFYVCAVAIILKKNGVVVEFSHEDHDTSRPLIVAWINGDLSRKRFRVLIHFSPPTTFAKLQRFQPKNSNLQASFCFHVNKFEEPFATPMYNTGIVSDLVRNELEIFYERFFSEKESVSQALILLRLWLRNRNFFERCDGFDDRLLYAWLIYLYEKKEINEYTTIVDIISTFFKSISSTSWSLSMLGISSDIDSSIYVQFKEHFDYVFLDTTGYFNIAANLSLSAYNALKDVALDSLSKLSSFRHFDTVFLRKWPFTNNFDVFISITIEDDYLRTDLLDIYTQEYIGSCGNHYRIIVKYLNKLLDEAWNGRVSVFDFERVYDGDRKFKLNEKCDRKVETLIVGMRLIDGWDKIITRGPSAKSSDAGKFVKFWGKDRCQLRKFADNDICESVEWCGEMMASHIPYLICKYISSLHMKLRARFSERSSFPNGIHAFDSVRSWSITKAYDRFTQCLRLINDLPLQVTSVHPISPHLRKTLPFPSPSIGNLNNQSDVKCENGIIVPSIDRSSRYIQSVEIELSLESSGKWGNDVEAIKHLKTAFYISLAAHFRKKFSSHAVPYREYLIVIMDDVLFRISISYPKLTYLLQRGISNDAVAVDDLKGKLAEREMIAKPLLAAYLYSTHQLYPAFAETCRIVHRWFSALMLSDYIHADLLETIIASVFISPRGSAPPRTAYSGILCFLVLLSTHNWLMKPLIVNFNDCLEEKQLSELEASFIKMRPVLPAMVVFTPADTSGVGWTREEPQPLILKRIISFAQSAVSFLQQNLLESHSLSFKSIFSCSTSVYDVLLVLNKDHLVRRANNFPKPLPIEIRCVEASKTTNVPVFDYDPVKTFIKTLRSSFSSLAYFFYNKYGGSVIGVLWKRSTNTMAIRDPKISSCFHRKMLPSEDSIQLNINEIIEEFIILGHGLVHHAITNEL